MISWGTYNAPPHPLAGFGDGMEGIGRGWEEKGREEDERGGGGKREERREGKESTGEGSK